MVLTTWPKKDDTARYFTISRPQFYRICIPKAPEKVAVLYLSSFFPLLSMTSSQLKVGPPHFKKRPYFLHLQCLFPFQVPST
ncbi:hypothetical protein NC652_032562 [Populus alba x Populus x berolinensis]|nr:hypothetical protein NC652_032562 [Populus alba x Populus x berolinensis]